MIMLDFKQLFKWVEHVL